MKTVPERERFISLAQKANVVPVTIELFTDMDTPVSIYYKLVGEEPGFILESVDTSRQFGRFSFIGAEPFAKVRVFKNRTLIKENGQELVVKGTPTEALKSYLGKYQAAVEDPLIPLLGGGAVGYFNYEVAATFDRIRGLSIEDDELLGQFMICRILVVVDHLKNKMQLTYLAGVLSDDDAAEVYEDAIKKIVAIRKKLKNAHIEAVKKTYPARKLNFLAKYGEPPSTFLEKIRIAKEHIAAGDIFQIVPSQQFSERLTHPPFLFYRRLRQVNPSPYMFYMNFGMVKLVGASPEMLVKLSGDTVYTYPIAGTRKRGKDIAEDEILGADLKADEKECAEHAMLVDLSRNDIGRISKPGTVHLKKFMQIEKFSHVMHMVSEVCGTTREGYKPMDVLKACFPAGTVSGAPKIRAMEIINELEDEKRNAYSGAAGYIDFNGNMDMCITLRTMRIEGMMGVIQSGAGIVADSVAETEYKEILQKSKALFEVVEEVENNDFIA